MKEEDWQLIIHKKCGLDIELCVCPDAKIKAIKNDKWDKPHPPNWDPTGERYE